MPTFTLTQNYDIRLVMRDLLLDWSGSDSLMRILPMTFKDTSRVVWEQRDNFWGLMPLRGLNGTPDVLPMPGSKRFTISPGYYGAQHVIGEEEWMLQRELGTANETIDEQMLFADASMSLAAKTYNRIRWINSTLLTTGAFKVENRGKVHEYKVDGYTLATTATAWSTPSTSTPIADIQALQQTYSGFGTSSTFGPGSRIIMQQYLANLMMQSNEVKSIIKTDFGATPQGLPGVNKVLTNYGLPEIEIYNEGYFATQTASGTPSSSTRFLPQNKFIWVGQRPNGEPFGEFVLTRNMVNQSQGGVPADYKEIDFDGPADLRRGLYTMLRRQDMPPGYTIDAGFNGGPAIYYRTAVMGVTVG